MTTHGMRFGGYDPGRRRFLRGAAVVGAMTAMGSLAMSCDDGGRHVVEMTVDHRFEPAQISLAKGQSVTWVNRSSETHSTTTVAKKATGTTAPVLPQGAAAWDSGDVTAGRQWTHVFDVPGRYAYFCAYHQAEGEIGQIVVSDH